ncbi:GAF domain-containing protein [Streptomyces formicae]|uniref:GAF domain-containing protein n=1 Tax=Streptomyces formicae TaxID=1616117 RepID=A0ABY3WUE4_9ACTN|nr:GAF domain-containing protein [Streptomyces formicae]UNM14932.1 GAF domain-containing protein [Streptomyces formicae]
MLPGTAREQHVPSTLPALPALLDTVLEAVLEAVLSVGTAHELHTALQHIVDRAAELTGARYGALAVVDPERGRATERFTSGGPDPGMRRPLGVPIHVHTEVFGHLCLADKRSGPFTGDDLALLRILGSQAGIAISNARLHETARQRERWIEGADAVTTALLTREAAADALTTVAERARMLAEASAGVVLQPTEEGGMEIVAASTLGDPADLVGTTIEPGSDVLAQLLGGEPVFIEDSATDPWMTTPVRHRFGPSMMLPLQSGGKLIGTLALPRRRGGRPYTAVERLLATQFASQAALALVLADAQHNRERLAVYEDRDRIARDLHDLVVQRLFATEMMLESTRRRAASSPSPTSSPTSSSSPSPSPSPSPSTSTSTSSPSPSPSPSCDDDALLGRAVDELDSTIQEVRTAIFALQQPPADAPTTFRGRVLRETGGAAALLGFQPSVHFTGAVDVLVREPQGSRLLAALRGALAAAHRGAGVTGVDVSVDATATLPDGRAALRLTVTTEGAASVLPFTWQALR